MESLISANGSVLIPGIIREKYKLIHGSRVYLEECKNGIMLVPVKKRSESDIAEERKKISAARKKACEQGGKFFASTAEFLCFLEKGIKRSALKKSVKKSDAMNIHVMHRHLAATGHTALKFHFPSNIEC